jgi:hypothetical protein
MRFWGPITTTEEKKRKFLIIIDMISSIYMSKE